MSTRAYGSRRRPEQTDETRRKITAAVAELMAEGTFHESTVEQVAHRAGISRATLYQHFRSRLDLVDAICDRFDENPALVRIRTVVELPDPGAALAETIANAVRFWASEDPVLSQLYGIVAIDPAARDLVDRQRADRRGEITRLVRHLQGAGWLRPGLTEDGALALLMLFTSYDAFREMREAGASEPEVVATLQQGARQLLSAPA